MDKWMALCTSSYDDGTFIKGKIYIPNRNWNIIYENGEIGSVKFHTFEDFIEFWNQRTASFRQIKTNER